MSKPTRSPELAVDLVEQFERFGPAYVRWVAENVPRDGISPQRLRLLAVLRSGGSASMRDLGARLGVTGRAITQLVDALERDGLVRRLSSASDRRITLVEVTPDGEAIAARDHRRHREAVGRLFESLGPTRMSNLLDIVSALNDELRTTKRED